MVSIGKKAIPWRQQFLIKSIFVSLDLDLNVLDLMGNKILKDDKFVCLGWWGGGVFEKQSLIGLLIVFYIQKY